MGFPVGYTELFFPKLLIHTLTFLGFIRKFISWFFKFMGLDDFLESSDITTWPSERPTTTTQTTSSPVIHSVSALLIREILLPVIKFQDLSSSSSEQGDQPPPDCCAVCLYEFESQEEIRRLTNCLHIFHRSCLDRWMDHDQKTCPLCRTPFIPDEMQEAFNEKLWAASGIPDFYGDFSISSSF